MSNETLMTETATTTTESHPASDTASQPATGAETASPQQGTDGQQTETSQQEVKPEGAPESYDFKAPEGKEFSPEVLGKFAEVAKELNLSQDAAQGMLDKMAPAFAERQANVIEQARNQWAESSKADKEFGGDKLAENIGVAQKALDQFGSAEFKTLLNESGLGNHPEVIRFMVRAGKAISEDRIVTGASGAQPTGDARKLYANSNMNP